MPTTSSKANRTSTQIRLDPDVRLMLRNRWAASGVSQSDSVNDAVRRVFGGYTAKPPTKPAA
jgi:hypothetical protein